MHGRWLDLLNTRRLLGSDDDGHLPRLTKYPQFSMNEMLWMSVAKADLGRGSACTATPKSTLCGRSRHLWPVQRMMIASCHHTLSYCRNRTSWRGVSYTSPMTQDRDCGALVLGKALKLVAAISTPLELGQSLRQIAECGIGTAIREDRETAMHLHRRWPRMGRFCTIARAKHIYNGSSQPVI